MIAAIITKLQSPHPEISPITFILTQHCLVTVRDIAPTSFQQFSRRILQSADIFNSADAVLEGLLEEVLTRVAHNAELLMHKLDELSHCIFGAEALDGKTSNHGEVMKRVLLQLGAASDLNSKINESLHSIARLLSFYYELEGHDDVVKSAISTLKTDTKVLIQQSSFTADKITFQLDATLGFINVEQNMIIKIFSVVAVFFLPPTMVSSIYGMNFQHMPELQWLAGYPMALTIMILFAVVPYVYFKKKGWL
jgi:magnesium transporter